ncbi:aromatic ring-hydroxylating dioxygenase subunit alpha [uncultured Tepidimonas sp.]|uniref:aromatic ring-hydroxylating oxygenase subunit alpha n=1 Tax=uncultured Tepidimonas sp. TaxID=453579 RepID=UPI00261233C3|nr:aromatic ring-hydroxylating dioxygenase subunit alpha [uncultured Tepidimonas sp.]
MVERDHWWPVALASAVGPTPLSCWLLGEPLVLWRDEAGAMQVLADRCPHRGARLSLGAVVQGQLQCPYHGWRFDGAGRCRAIPALPAFIPAPAQAAHAYAACEAHGMVWVCLGQPRVALPALPDLPPRCVAHGPFDVATSAPRVVENFLDTAHFAFVHDGWLGEPAHADVPPYAVSHTPDGRPFVADYPAWQPRASAGAQQGAWVRYRYEVLSPFAAMLQKRPDGDGPADAYVLWVCPMQEESCRVWFVQHTTDFDTPDESLRTFQAMIFAQDQPILESQTPKRLPLYAGGEAMCAADRLSAAYRRYLRDTGIAYGVC